MSDYIEREAGVIDELSGHFGSGSASVHYGSNGRARIEAIKAWNRRPDMSEKYIRMEEAKYIIKIYQAVAKNDTEALVANELDIVINRIPTYTPADILAGMWVPVTERLPDERQWVLVYSTTFGWDVDYQKDGRFREDDVTHWMPLPEPPKPQECGDDFCLI